MLCARQRALAGSEAQMLSCLHDLEVGMQTNAFSGPASSPALPLCLFLKSPPPKERYKNVC